MQRRVLRRVEFQLSSRVTDLGAPLSTSNRILLGAIIVLTVLVVVALWSPAASSTVRPNPAAAPAETPKTQPPAVSKKGSAAENSPSSLFYIGHNSRPIHSIFTTRRKDVTYQALVRYQPVDVPAEEVPGIDEIAQVYDRAGKVLPQFFRRIDQESEMTTNNMGEPLRFITSIKYYLNEADGSAVVAYDMAQTTGGQPQRMLGHRTRTGMAIKVYRGGQQVDTQEITFTSKTWIPVEYEFIHQLYQQQMNAEDKAAHVPLRYNIFVPEAMAQVALIARPIDDEVISVGDARYTCTRYEVKTASTQSTEGTFALQQMWFDKQTSLLMRRKDFDASLDPAEAPITEREAYQRIEELGRLSPLPIEPPKVPEKSADFLLDQEFVYTVKARSANIGRVALRFSKYDSGKSVPNGFKPEQISGKPAYVSTSRVQVAGGESLRDETAVTLYDEQWRPLHYETRGVEHAGAKLDYRVNASLGGGKISVSTHRDALPELKRSAAYKGAMAGCEAGLLVPKEADESAWRDPLKRVPIDEDEASALESQASPRLLDQSWVRALPEGTFISDFNRVEHLMLLAARLPIPPAPKNDDEQIKSDYARLTVYLMLRDTGMQPQPFSEEPVKVAFQKAALYLVRQNRCGVLLFDIRPEPRNRLTERQRQRLSDAERNEPRLFVANAGAAMMPCRMLLTPDGRILELSMKYGSGDVTYTLDDPIMRRREEAAERQRMQEGPRLLRPPWW